MSSVIEFGGDIIGRFDPNDPVNLTLFFSWVVIFTVTFAGVWRAPQRWARLLCYVVNQVASFGLLQAGVLTFAIFLGHWRETIAAACVTLVASCWMFRERRSGTWGQQAKGFGNSMTSQVKSPL